MTAPILVIGASSGIGAAAVAEARARDLPVRAFARSAGEMAPEPGLEPFPGDARDPGDMRRAVEGVRAVIHAIGISEKLSSLGQEVTLFSESTAVLIAAMQAAGVSRLVAVTGFGAGRSKQALSGIERVGHQALLGRSYADKDRQEALIEASGLDWTIVRPVILTNGPADGRFQVLRTPEEWRNGLISRGNVARYLVDAIEAARDVHGDVVLAD